MISPLFCEICGEMPARIAPQGIRCRACYAEEKRMEAARGNPVMTPMSVAEFLGHAFGIPKPPSDQSGKP